MNKIFVDLEMHPIDRKFEEVRKIASNEIIEIGAVMLGGEDTEISRFQSFVRPEYMVEYSPFIADLTKIREEDLREARPFSQVLSDFVAWCSRGGEEYVVYSWSDSDLYQMEDDIDSKHIETNEAIEYMLDGWEDFQEAFGDLLGFHKRQSLKNAVEMLGIDTEGYAHDALFDAVNTAKLYQCTQDPDAEDNPLRKIQSVLKPAESSGVTLGDLFDFSKLGGKGNS